MMKSMQTAFLCLAVLCSVYPREGMAQPMARRSAIGLGIGACAYFGRESQSENHELFSVVNSAGAANLAVDLSYAYWVREDVAFGLEVGVLGGEARNEVSIRSGVSSQAVAVTAVMLGGRFYLPKPSPQSLFRPYLSAGLGPVIGSVGKSTVKGKVENSAVTSATFGGRAGGGADIILSRRFMLGIQAECNLMTDFPENIGGRRNYSGFKLGVGLSVLFGKGA